MLSVQAENFIELGENILSSSSQHVLGCNMNIIGHLNRFPENLADFSGEQREKIYQDIKTMEDQNEEKWDSKMTIGIYCETVLANSV